MAHNDPFITVIYGNSKPQRGERDDPASLVSVVKLIANQPYVREWAANKVVWLSQPKRSPRHSGYGMPFTRKVKAANPGCLAFPWSAETAEPLSAQSIPVFKCGPRRAQVVRWNGKQHSQPRGTELGSQPAANGLPWKLRSRAPSWTSPHILLSLKNAAIFSPQPHLTCCKGDLSPL